MQLYGKGNLMQVGSFLLFNIILYVAQLYEVDCSILGYVGVSGLVL